MGKEDLMQVIEKHVYDINALCEIRDAIDRFEENIKNDR